MSINDLAYFTECVNNLIDGELIMVDKNIASVLKCVVNCPVLCQCLSSSIKNTSYVTEFSRAKVTWTRSDGVVINQLKLPQDTTRLFTFVVCLLTEIDSGRRSITDFLHEFFGDTDNNASYRKFVSEVIKPFKRAGESLLKNTDHNGMGKEESAIAERFFTAEKIFLRYDVIKSMSAIVNELKQLLLDEGKLSKSATSDVYAVSNYFVNALHLRNPKIIKICWIAYRNTMLRFHLAQPYVIKLAQLVDSAVIM